MGRAILLAKIKMSIAFSSKSLSETETRYFQIEKEFLAITYYACKKYHNYIYGQKADLTPSNFSFFADLKKCSPARMRRRLTKKMIILSAKLNRSLRKLLKIWRSAGIGLYVWLLKAIEFYWKICVFFN